MKSFFFRLRHWETWHYLAKYIPVMPVWLWYCLKARSFWFFTASNPTITFGGFEGESKREMFDQLPPGSYPKTTHVPHSLPFDEVRSLMANNKIDFPIAVKPDVGMMGFMFRKIESIEKLQFYHSRMPVNYLIQEFVSYPIEVSIFYYRLPDTKKGTITGFIRKEFLEVIGDGRTTLGELINNYPRVRFRLEEMRSKHESRLDQVLKAGERYCLSNALNLSRGGKLVSLEHEKNDQLLDVFDELSHYTRHFYYGRYDIKCASIDDLKRGKNFYILEYNGCGAEPHHIYGNGNSLLEAYRIVLRHWKMLYRISSYNHHHRGIGYWKFSEGWAFLRRAKKHFRMLKKLDIATEL